MFMKVQMYLQLMIGSKLRLLFSQILAALGKKK